MKRDLHTLSFLDIEWSARLASIANTHAVDVVTIHGAMDSPSMVAFQCGRVTHICVSKLAIIGSHNGLAPGWRQAIIWTNAGIVN